MSAKRRRRSSSINLILVGILLTTLIQLSGGQSTSQLDDSSEEDEIETSPASKVAADAAADAVKGGHVYKTREETDCDLETTSVSCMIVGARITRDILPSDWAEGNMAINRRGRPKRAAPSSNRRGIELGFKIGSHDDDDDEKGGQEDGGWPEKEKPKKFGPFSFSFTRGRPRKRPAPSLNDDDELQATHSPIPIPDPPPSQNYYERPHKKPHTAGYDRPSYGRPSSSYDRPSSNYDRPSLNYDRPSSSYDRPSSNYDRPSSSYDRPKSNYGRPSSNYKSQSSNYKSPSSNYDYHDSSYDRPASNDDRPYSNFAQNSYASDSDELPITSHNLDYSPPPPAQNRPSSSSSHAQKSVPKSQTYVLPEEALLSLKFDEPADSQKPTWSFFPGSEEDEIEAADVPAIISNSNHATIPTETLRPIPRRPNSSASSSPPSGHQSRRPTSHKPSEDSAASPTSFVPTTQSTESASSNPEKDIEMYIVAENGDDMSDLQEHLKGELELVNNGAVAAQTTNGDAKLKIKKPQKDSGGAASSSTSGGGSTTAPKQQRVKSGGKISQKINPTAAAAAVSSTPKSQKKIAVVMTTTSTTSSTSMASTSMTSTSTTASSPVTTTTSTTTTEKTTTTPPSPSTPAPTEPAEESDEDIVIVDDGSFQTETQKKFGAINSNFTGAATFVQSTMIQKKPVLKNTFLVKEEGMTCTDLCDPSPDGLGFALLGLCTPFYCKCQFGQNMQHVPMTCDPDNVFDPVKLTCNDPEDTVLCSDDPKSLLPSKPIVGALPLVQAVLPHSSAGGISGSGGMLEMVPLLYYLPDSQAQLVVNPSDSSSKLQHYDYGTPPIVKTEQFQLPSTTQILKSHQLQLPPLTQTVKSKLRVEPPTFDFSFPERKSNFQFGQNSLTNHKVPEPYGYLTVPPSDISTATAAGSSSQVPLTTRPLYKVQSPIPVIPNFPPRA